MHKVRAGESGNFPKDQFINAGQPKHHCERRRPEIQANAAVRLCGCGLMYPLILYTYTSAVHSARRRSFTKSLQGRIGTGFGSQPQLPSPRRIANGESIISPAYTPNPLLKPCQLRVRRIRQTRKRHTSQVVGSQTSHPHF